MTAALGAVARSPLPVAIANHFWQSTLVAFVACFLSVFLRKSRARVRHTFWFFCSTKFLVPFSLLALIGRHTAIPSGEAAQLSFLALAVDAITRPYEPASAPHINPSLWAGNRLLFVFAFAWLLGAALLAFTWMKSWLSLRRIRVTAKLLLHGREAEALARAANKMHMEAGVTLLQSNQTLEPGVLGLWRPCLLWPTHLSVDLNDAQLEAVMCHELEHLRCHDNAKALIHMLVSAIFWFHPLVWWLQRKLMQSREQACDEAVLEAGCTGHVYAMGLLRVCEFCVTAPLPCVAGVAGASLKQRVLQIGSNLRPIPLALPLKLLLLGIAALILAAPIASGRVQSVEAYDLFFLCRPIAPPPPAPRPPEAIPR